MDCPPTTVVLAALVGTYSAWLGGWPHCTPTHTQPRCCSLGQPQCSCARSTCGAWAAAATGLGQAAAACGPQTAPGASAVACVQMPSRSQASCSTQHSGCCCCALWHVCSSGLLSHLGCSLPCSKQQTFVCAHCLQSTLPTSQRWQLCPAPKGCPPCSRCHTHA